MREVLEWPAAEVAAALDTTPAAVNSGLQRARARLGELGIGEDQVGEPAAADQRALVDRYVTAFVDADLTALAGLLTEDVVLEMPPVINWYRGREHYIQFMAHVFAMRGPDWRMLPAAANGQPAAAAYVRAGAGYEIHSLQVFSVTASDIGRNVVYVAPAVWGAFDTWAWTTARSGSRA
jgi:RNA polymerase sigma-70 factor (ECF subfamily)